MGTQEQHTPVMQQYLRIKGEHPDVLLEVHVVGPEARPMEKVLGAEVGDFIRGLHERHGVTFHFGTTAAKIGAQDVTLQELAPSTALRKWFGHDPARCPEFRLRYADEIREHLDELGQLRSLARKGPVTLVYSAHDELHNDAVVLRELLLSR